MTQEERRALAIHEREYSVYITLQKMMKYSAMDEEARVDCGNDAFYLELYVDEKVAELHSLRFDEESEFGCDDNNGCRIISHTDRERLKQSFPHWVDPRRHADERRERPSDWESIFWHWDNINYFARLHGDQVPAWFSEKYHHRHNNM